MLIRNYVFVIKAQEIKSKTRITRNIGRNILELFETKKPATKIGVLKKKSFEITNNTNGTVKKQLKYVHILKEGNAPLSRTI